MLSGSQNPDPRIDLYRYQSMLYLDLVEGIIHNMRGDLAALSANLTVIGIQTKKATQQDVSTTQALRTAVDITNGIAIVAIRSDNSIILIS